MNDIRRPVFHNGHSGHWANLMIRYMVGVRLRSLCPGLVLSDFRMPYWGIDHPLVPSRAGETSLVLHDEQHVPIERLVYLLRSGTLDRLDWRGYGARMENFPERDLCCDLFSAQDATGTVWDESHAVCPIRSGADTIEGQHGGYVLLPPGFYRAMFDRLGLKPVFMGEIGDNSYCDTLRRMFPDAIFAPTGRPLHDFQTIRSARTLIVSVSTFAWLAAWLSSATRIVLPIIGLYHPEQFPQVDLLPLGDPRYEFWRFPQHWAVRSADVPAAHAAIEGQWALANAAAAIRL